MKPSWLRDVLHGGLTLLAAFVVHAALRWITVPFLIALDVYAVAVILFALVKGEIAGAVMGTACGLVIDSFSLGVFGLAGAFSPSVFFGRGFPWGGGMALLRPVATALSVTLLYAGYRKIKARRDG